MTRNEFAKKLIEWRVSNGYSVYDAIRVLAVARADYSAMEEGRLATPYAIKHVAEAIGVAPPEPSAPLPTREQRDELRKLRKASNKGMRLTLRERKLRDRLRADIESLLPAFAGFTRQEIIGAMVYGLRPDRVRELMAGKGWDSISPAEREALEHVIEEEE